MRIKTICVKHWRILFLYQFNVNNSIMLVLLHVWVEYTYVAKSVSDVHKTLFCVLFAYSNIYYRDVNIRYFQNRIWETLENRGTQENRKSAGNCDIPKNVLEAKFGTLKKNEFCGHPRKVGKNPETGKLRKSHKPDNRKILETRKSQEIRANSEQDIPKIRSIQKTQISKIVEIPLSEKY